MILFFLSSIYAICLLFIGLFCLQEAFLAYKFLFLQAKIPHLPPIVLPPIEAEQLPFVTVQLPIFNEQNVAARAIDALAALDYPLARLEIQILDDSTDHTLDISRQKALYYRQAKGLAIFVLHRSNRNGYKAGALQEGLLQAKGDIIAIFDADFVPKPDFLQQVLPYLHNPKTAAVQVRWGHLNADYSILTQLQTLFIDTHFFVEQTARCASGYFLNFNGTAGIWRRSSIEKAGGWQADTLTEDLDLSYRAQLGGEQIQYVPYLNVSAELPATMTAVKSQQYRWVKGGAETARKILPRLLTKSLPLRVKMAATGHLLAGSIYMAVWLMAMLSFPILCLFHYKQVLQDSYFMENNMQVLFLNIFNNGAIYVFFWVISQTAILFVYSVTIHFSPHFKTQKWWQQLGVLMAFLAFMLGLSFHNAKAAASGWVGFKTSFVRTPKYNLQQKSDKWQNKAYTNKEKYNKSFWVEMVLAFYFALAACVAILWGNYWAASFYGMAMIGFAWVGGLEVWQQWVVGQPKK